MSKKCNPLATLWIGRVNVYEYREVTNAETWETTHELVKVISDEPCRVSFGQTAYSKGKTVDVSEGVPYIAQTITMFCRPDLEIKEGSVLEISQHNKTIKYKRASVPAIHSLHQEVLLELYEDNA